MMSANWVSVKIMVPSECRPTGFLPTARPPGIDSWSLPGEIPESAYF